MDLWVNPAAIRDSIGLVEQAHSGVEEAVRRAASAPINGSYSSVPGLMELAAVHQACFVGGAGSVHDVCVQLAEQLQWVRDGMRATGEALTGQEMSSARGLDISDDQAGQRVVPESVLFPAREEFQSHPLPMTTGITIAGGESLLSLRLALSTTDHAQAQQAAQGYRAIADILDAAAADVDAAGKLPGCDGEVFELARRQCARLVGMLGLCAQNCRSLAQSVGQLRELHRQAARDLAAIAAEVQSEKDPAAKAAKETELLDEWLLGPWQQACEAAIPGVVGLLEEHHRGSSGAAIVVGAGSGVTAWQPGAWEHLLGQFASSAAATNAVVTPPPVTAPAAIAGTSGVAMSTTAVSAPGLAIGRPVARPGSSPRHLRRTTAEPGRHTRRIAGAGLLDQRTNRPMVGAKNSQLLPRRGVGKSSHSNRLVSADRDGRASVVARQDGRVLQHYDARHAGMAPLSWRAHPQPQALGVSGVAAATQGGAAAPEATSHQPGANEAGTTGATATTGTSGVVGPSGPGGTSGAVGIAGIAHMARNAEGEQASIGATNPVGVERATVLGRAVDNVRALSQGFDVEDASSAEPGGGAPQFAENSVDSVHSQVAAPSVPSAQDADVPHDIAAAWVHAVRDAAR